MTEHHTNATNETKAELDLSAFDQEATEHEYVEDLSELDKTDAEKFINVGVDTAELERIGTFIQKDRSVVHCKAVQEGVDVMAISKAREKYDWVDDYLWKNVSPDKDAFTRLAKEKPMEGYFIRVRPGVKTQRPIQSCLYISQEKASQNVHNLVIAEEGSEVHIITGCATAPHLLTGLHIGVSEFYIKKNAKVMFTMIHEWGEQVHVRPRTVTVVEEGGLIISNYISLKPLGTLEMFPTTYLNGPNAVARYNSIMVAGQGTKMDVGSRIILNAPGSRAEIISRAVCSGGTIIARGDLIGKAKNIKAHLECKGLILNDGVMRAIPELTGYVPDVEMSHEAAVGKIDKREIEYLMSRGLDEDEAVSTIVRGFLDVKIEGLPKPLQDRLDHIISETQKDMM